MMRKHDMIKHIELSNTVLHSLIKQQKITFGGNNKQLKIYGLLGCKSGKRMKTKNRVFFSTEKEALSLGFRPCGHCMQQQYRNWKNETV